MNLFTMGDVARASLNPYHEDRLYKTFGINAELIIDHAWGWEPTTIPIIKSYRPSAKSISSGQVLKEPYENEEGIYDGSPEPLFIAGKSVTDPEGGTEVKLAFEEKTPMRVTVIVVRYAPDAAPARIGYAEYDIENGKVTLVGEPDTEGLKELDD